METKLTIQRINELKSFERINKIDKILVNLNSKTKT